MAEKKGLAQEAALAQTGIGALRPGTLTVSVQEGIAAKSVHDILDRIFRLHGCVACGLAGLDLRFRVEDSLLVEKFRDIEGVRDVTLIR
ncbi:MAG: hypothetical protein AB7G75_17080 [Candidatus Binatia bacterium]